MRLRSLLYVPASSERFIAKAHTRGADAIILDLEDAVAAGHKDEARSHLSQSIATAGQGGAKIFVRINADPETALRDAIAAVEGGADGLYVAKADPGRLEFLDRKISGIETGIGKSPLSFVALIEDAAALLAADKIAVSPRVMALSCGGEDLANALGAHPDADVLRLPKQLVHYAARARNLYSFGLFQSTADYADIDRLAMAAAEARRFGFDGATCVHPSAVPILNAAFSPTQEEAAWAREVVALSDRYGRGAFAMNGQMVDAPVIARARRILSQLPD